MNGAMYPNHYSLPGVFSGFTDNRAAMNGSLWVIAPLFFTYLIALVLGVCRLLRRPGAVLALAAVALAAWEVYEIHGIAESSRWKKYEVWIDFVPHLSFFFLCGVLTVSWEKLSVNAWGALIALVAVVICVGLHPQKWVTYTVITLAIPVITIWSSFVRWSWLRPVNVAGVIAYGVYLYSWPVQQLFMRVWTPNQSGIEQILYPCVVCATLGTLSWFLIEAPALRLARRK
jgi:peptidoglycan/LPS O-acetylase OafA/YrhL